LWHDSLTDEQKQELKIWYVDWLTVTKTRKQPSEPAWLFLFNATSRNDNLRRDNENRTNNH
jgi:hypothetical protein